MIKKLNNSDMNNNGLLDIFKGKLKGYIRQYGSSFSSSVEQVEMASLMAFMLIQQYNGKISCEDLANRIESTLQGIIDQNDAERIATYVFDQYALMNKESIVNNVIPTSPIHTQVKIVQKPVQKCNMLKISESSHLFLLKITQSLPALVLFRLLS